MTKDKGTECVELWYRYQNDRELAPLEAGLRQLFTSVIVERITKVVFVPLRSNKDMNTTGSVAMELTIKLCKYSDMKALRSNVVQVAREVYGCADEELAEEDLQLVDIFRQKVIPAYTL